MSLDIRKYLMEKLIDPLKYYNTSTQDIILATATKRLQYLYNVAEKFPDIVDIDQVTEYMLKDIAASFGHELNRNQSVAEQRGVISNLIETYKRRGSIESIENMHKYYGGNLPKDVKVVIPAYNLFRYSISPYSGTHRLKDGQYWRSGVFELLIRDDFDLNLVKDFVTDELVAGGVRVLFSRELTMGDSETNGPLRLDTMKPMNFALFLTIELALVTLRTGLQYSVGTEGYSGTLPLSGSQTLFTQQEMFIEAFAPMTRSKEDSIFILDPSEIIEYFPYPDKRPINLLSGFPVIGTPIPVEDPETLVGLDSAIGAHRSYDYMYPAKQLFWNIYPQRTSEHGRLSGKNALSGTPTGGPGDKSWLEFKRQPTKLDKLYERGIDKNQLILDADVSPDVDDEDRVTKDTLIEVELKSNMYGSDSTPDDIKADISINLTDGNDRPIPPAPTGNYPGYFVLATTPLGGYMLSDQTYNGDSPLTTTA